jgi:hypothetical protein
MRCYRGLGSAGSARRLWRENIIRFQYEAGKRRAVVRDSHVHWRLSVDVCYLHVFMLRQNLAGHEDMVTKTNPSLRFHEQAVY